MGPFISLFSGWWICIVLACSFLDRSCIYLLMMFLCFLLLTMIHLCFRSLINSCSHLFSHLFLCFILACLFYLFSSANKISLGAQSSLFQSVETCAIEMEIISTIIIIIIIYSSIRSPIDPYNYIHSSSSSFSYVAYLRSLVCFVFRFFFFFFFFFFFGNAPLTFRLRVASIPSTCPLYPFRLLDRNGQWYQHLLTLFAIILQE